MHSGSRHPHFRRRPGSALRRRGTSYVDVIMGTMLLGWGVLCFVALYPSASVNARLTTDYSQAISEVQHKVDQLRSIGYGRLTYTELRTAGIIDAAPTTAPFRFEASDSLSTYLQSPVGTISFSSLGSGLTQVNVSLAWRTAVGRTHTHDVSFVVAQE